jgi:hypothetical protein
VKEALFFEKKKQKTFAPARLAAWVAVVGDVAQTGHQHQADQDGAGGQRRDALQRVVQGPDDCVVDKPHRLAPGPWSSSGHVSAAWSWISTQKLLSPLKARQDNDLFFEKKKQKTFFGLPPRAAMLKLPLHVKGGGGSYYLATTALAWLDADNSASVPTRTAV